MKELPYFKITVQEWQNGSIRDLNDSARGVFMDICCYYWAQNCEVTEKMLSIRFKTKSKTIQKLIECGSIKSQTPNVSISFLNQQLSELKQTKSFFSEMGKLGQKAKKSQAPLKPPLKTETSYKIKEDNIKQEEEFKSLFDTARNLYPGTKSGLEPEWLNFTKKHPLETSGLLLKAIKNQMAWKKELDNSNEFVPPWKHFKTWINNQCWTEEKQQIEKTQDSTMKVF